MLAWSPLRGKREYNHICHRSSFNLSLSGLQKASSQFKRPAVVTVDLNHFDDCNFDTRSLGEPVSPGVGSNGRDQQETNGSCNGLFETAIQSIPNDLCITFTTSGTLRATITRLYQAQKEATVRLLLTGITEDCIDTAINQLPFRRFMRVWCHPDVNSAILRIMRGCRHEVTSRTFFHYIANAVQDIPNHSPTSIKGVGSTKFHSTPGQRSKEGDEGIKCRTRAGRDNWPNVMLEVGCFGTAVPAPYRRRMVVGKQQMRKLQLIWSSSFKSHNSLTLWISRSGK